MPLDISKHRFILESTTEVLLPGYKGAYFRDQFGPALNYISPTWGRYFFEPSDANNKNDCPKPFVILPPLDERESYPKGYRFQVDVTLFGKAAQHYMVVQSAIEQLGCKIGIGSNSGKYKIIGIEHSAPEMQAHNMDVKKQHLKISFSTRFRTKTNDKLLTKAPPFSLFIARLITRLNKLEETYAQSHSDFQNLLSESKQVCLTNSTLKWEDWRRSTKEKMVFGGLMGDVCYEGDLTPFMDLLQLGEWLHVGKQTSFGLGKYIIKG